MDDCPAAPACQLVLCSAKGLCAYVPAADGGPCSDGNACTTKDTCAGGACAGGPALNCDDDNPCTASKCNPLAGCVILPAAPSTACDDGEPCTQGDTCAGGQCQSGVNICQCQTQSDCGKFEDGNACNGKLYCDKSKGAPYVCAVNPATLVVCSSDQDGPCQKNTCLPSTGECKLVVAPPNTPCSDGDKCTAGDFCEQGLCQGGANTCFCKQTADCKAFEDGNACNGTLFCNKATSQCELNPQTVVSCQTVDNTACLQNLCNPKEGKCHLIPVAEGKPCDDGNACTPNETCQAGACATATNVCECTKNADCAAKEDGNLCNGTLYCDVKANKCAVNPATVVVCNTDDDPQCLRDVCNPATGKCAAQALPKDGTACDDGNPCTPADTCSNGQCVATANTCECSQDSDCAAKEDGNLCNGTLYCDKKAGKCVVNPATVVECTGAFDETCLTNQCDKKTGKCGMAPTHQGNQCKGDAVCSGGGWCNLGSCNETETLACACIKDSDCGKFEDGDACNGTLYCDIGGAAPACKVNPASLVVCPTANDTACSKNQCAPATGKCAMQSLAAACDDGNACTLADACKAGACAGGIAKVCDDGNPCTDDNCLATSGCLSQPKGSGGCDDKNACTADNCDPKSGCVHGPAGGLCDDANPCTLADECTAGACSGKPVACDDGNPCTNDSCDPKSGCTTAAASQPCSDGNACTTGDTCAGGKCAGSGVLSCDDKNPCTADNCAPTAGCTSLPAAATCDDGDGCTIQEACKNGTCVGVAKACDDGNPCTDDSCDLKANPNGGCVAKPNSGACSDGNACTVGDLCSSGACKAGKAADCDDGNACTADGCAGQTGICVHQDVAASLCDDKNACTDDNCSPKAGCGHVNNAAACSDGDACTKSDACKNGTCLGGAATACGDGNPCTDDTCDAAKGCTYANNSAACDDGSGCTQNDVCSGGKCAGKLDCDDKNPCTADSCDAGTSQCAHPPQSGECDDGDACTTSGCAAGACKPLGLVSCDDGNACSDDSCDSKLGCVKKANAQPCDSGTCTAADACANLACKSSGKPKFFNGAWDSVADYNQDDDLFDVTAMPDGGWVAAGQTKRPGHGYFDGQIVRFDAAGTEKWRYTTLENGAERYNHTAIGQPDGSVIADGASMWFGGGHGYMVRYLRLDAAGKILVDVEYKGAGHWHNLPYRMSQVTVNGEQRVLIATRGDNNLGDFEGCEVFVLKQSDGSLLGYHDNTDPGQQGAYDVVGYPDGTYVYAGFSNGATSSAGTSGKAPAALGNKDFLLARVGADHKLMQQWRFGSGNLDEAGGLAITSDGGLIAVGVTFANPATNGDMYVVRLDKNFNKLWEKTFGGNLYDIASQVVAESNGRATVVGTEVVNSAQMGALFQLSAAGDKVWSKNIKSTSVGRTLYDVAAIGATGYVVVGVENYPAAALARTDPWGAVTCAESGQCADKASSACDDKEPCTLDACDGAAGCKYAPVNGPCDDNDVCSEGDACAGGKCGKGPTAVICNDNLPCTADTCDATKGCTYSNYPAGVTCGGGLACDGAGACK